MIKLHVSGNHFGPEGAAALSKGTFPKLEVLQMFDCQLGNDGVENLSKGEWKSLKELHLCIRLINIANNGIGDEGISYLADM